MSINADFADFHSRASTANVYPFAKNQFALPAQISLPASKASVYPLAKNQFALLA